MVIAIIAILAAMLLPALNKARDRARAISCSGNLKTIGQASMLYTDNWNGWIVKSDAKGDGVRKWWKNLIAPYAGFKEEVYDKDGKFNSNLTLKVSATKGPFYCPSTKTPEAKNTHNSEYDGSNYNIYCYGMPKSDNAEANKSKIVGLYWQQINSLRGKGASEQFLFGDVNDLGKNGDGSAISQDHMLNVWPNSAESMIRTSRRHFGGLNSAWLDGHVENRKPMNMVGKTNSKWKVGGHFCYYYMIAPGE